MTQITNNSIIPNSNDNKWISKMASHSCKIEVNINKRIKILYFFPGMFRGGGRFEDWFVNGFGDCFWG